MRSRVPSTSSRGRPLLATETTWNARSHNRAPGSGASLAASVRFGRGSSGLRDSGGSCLGAATTSRLSRSVFSGFGIARTVEASGVASCVGRASGASEATGAITIRRATVPPPRRTTRRSMPLRSRVRWPCLRRSRSGQHHQRHLQRPPFNRLLPLRLIRRPACCKPLDAPRDVAVGSQQPWCQAHHTASVKGGKTVERNDVRNTGLRSVR